MAGVAITWNSVSSTTIPELVFENPKRQMLGPSRGSFLDIPGRKGSWYYPDFRGRRQITVPGFILASSFPTGRRDAVTRVADWLDVDIEARLILGDEPTVYYEAVLTDVGDVEEWRELGKFEAQWMVQPYAFDINQTQIVILANNSYNTAFDPALLTTVYPVIEVKPTNGTITAFDLGINGESLSFIGNIAVNQTITINSISAVVVTGSNTDVQLTGAYDPLTLQMANVTGQFPYLQPGVNPFSFYRATGTATAITVTIKYRKAYRK